VTPAHPAAVGQLVEPKDRRASIAVDLGAESCRVSLLRWTDAGPAITLVHRFPNAPREVDGGLRWDLACVESGLDFGLRRCAGIATEGVRSIAVDGWAVDYVRLDREGKAAADPFCYRDERTIAAELSLHEKCSPERLRERTGIQLMRINTLYQLHADTLAGLPKDQRWLNLPEYILSRWGGAPVAEFTNASHTQMLDLDSRQWSGEIFAAAGLGLTSAPRLVPTGTVIGRLSGQLGELSAFADTVLIAPACHDTASAIAGIPATGDDWAYISSGTWSLVGTLLDHPINTPAAAADNFTNLGAVGNRICFHKNVNGMWLIRQCIAQWATQGTTWTVPDLIAAAERVAAPAGPAHLLDVEDPELLLSGHMPQRMNAQRVARGLKALDESPANAAEFASLIFHSLAACYARVLERIAVLSGKQFKSVCIVGGASQNLFLNRLTAEATGLRVIRGAPESSTVGNFAVQLATLEGSRDATTGVYAGSVSRWAEAIARSVEAP
jgi:rhamnulokinase